MASPYGSPASPPPPAGADVLNLRGDPSAGRRPARPLGRRAAVPAPRALLGGLLVILAAIGTYLAYTASNQGPTQKVVVARQSLPIGATIRPEDLASALVELPDVVLKTMFTDREALIGSTVLAPIGANEVINASAVRARDGRAEAPSRELVLSVDRSQTIRIKEGDSIDVLAQVGSGADARAEVVGKNLRVLATTKPESTGARTSGDAQVVVAVDEAQQQRLATIAGNDKITLVRTTGVAPSATPGSNGASDTRAPSSTSSSTASTASTTIATPTTPGFPPPAPTFPVTLPSTPTTVKK